MKKCPYCAEEIQDEAIVCRYCKRDLLPAQPTPSMPLSWTDLEKLTEASLSGYAQSGNGMSGGEMMSVIEPITKKWLIPVLTERFRHGATDQQEMQRRFLLGNAHCMQWGLLCFLIGVEAGSGQIPGADVPHYLAACAQPLFQEFCSHLSESVDKGWIKEKHKLKLARELETLLSRQSAKLVGYGRDRHKNRQPKFAPGESSPGSVLLRQMIRG